MPTTVNGKALTATNYLFTGDTVINGNIPANSHVEVRNGFLRVNGNVGDGAHLTQSGGATNAGAIVHRNNGASTQVVTANASVSVSGNSRVVINGVDMSNTQSNNTNAGINITGIVGKDAVIRAASSLVAAGVSDGARLKAPSVIINGDAGNITVDADSLITGCVGPKSQINARSSVGGGVCRR